MVVVLLIGVVALLYFRGASLQVGAQDAAKAAQPNTAASGVPASQSVSNDNTFNHVLDLITASVNAYSSSQTKVAETTPQKY